MGATAIVAGATGLIGIELVQCLLDNSFYNDVIVLVRKPTDLKHQKLKELVVNFEDLTEVAPYFAKAIVFCVLGTTIKIAKTKEAFRKVDYQYPLNLAELAQKQGAEQFHIVTAMGANPHSSIFYSQVKGRLESALKELELKSLHIYHPSLLLGNRREKRSGERIGAIVMKALSIILIGGLSKYKAIHVKKIARAMIYVSQQNPKGVHLYVYRDIIGFADQL